MPVTKVLLIITGGIAAYKSLDLVRRLGDRAIDVRCLPTEAAGAFVTPLSFAALSGNPVHQSLFSLTEESEMGHIRLARDCDLVVVAPATADFMAKAAMGLANDLASTVMLATDKPILMAPAMNPVMWSNPATQANVATLKSRGVHMVGPTPGDMACGEEGVGRMAEVADILAAIDALQTETAGSDLLAGYSALVTSGPTHEPIDPVRYIANRSSGKQGHAIASALQRHGAAVTLVSGPTQESAPVGVALHPVTSAQEMLEACHAALPVDIAVFAAAVADWRVESPNAGKIKKNNAEDRLTLHLVQNPDILADIASASTKRPKLVVGFAAETDSVIDFARAKRLKKKCDWILANDVSSSGNTGRGDSFGGDMNTVHLITADAVEDWPLQSKAEIGDRLAQRIGAFFSPTQLDQAIRRIAP
ncbi:MAG: bifunctional phosphopantothenoylcysteine decarboxylase/phosphopantothenate--cysteine ligase CoaBC [Rhodospirillaceae bacterium]